MRRAYTYTGKYFGSTGCSFPSTTNTTVTALAVCIGSVRSPRILSSPPSFPLPSPSRPHDSCYTHAASCGRGRHVNEEYPFRRFGADSSPSKGIGGVGRFGKTWRPCKWLPGLPRLGNICCNSPRRFQRTLPPFWSPSLMAGLEVSQCNTNRKNPASFLQKT